MCGMISPTFSARRQEACVGRRRRTGGWWITSPGRRYSLRRCARGRWRCLGSDRPRRQGHHADTVGSHDRGRCFALFRRQRGNRPAAANRCFHGSGADRNRAHHIADIEQAGWYPLRLARELDDAILSMRTNEPEIGRGCSRRGAIPPPCWRWTPHCWRTGSIGWCAKRSACCAGRSAGSTLPPAVCSP